MLWLAQRSESLHVLEVLGDLDLLGDVRASGKRLSAAEYEEMRSGSRRFELFALGTTNLSIRTFQSVMRKYRMSPPRSGHVGNWRPTVQGWGGMLDYNSAVGFQSSHGTPILADWTRTETEDLRDGDTIYRPASCLTREGAQELALYVWEGSRFSRVARSISRFLPFVLTEAASGGLQSLISWHHEHNQAPGWHFSYLSQQAIAKQECMRTLLAGAFKQCLQSPKPQSSFSLLIDRYARLDGVIERAVVHVDGARIEVGGIVYNAIDQLIDACMVPFQAAAGRDWWEANAARQPATVPLLSNLVAIALYPLLRTHETESGLADGELLLHPHWGAAGMAGFPPESRGYLAKQISTLRACINLLLATSSARDPAHSLIYLLAPAAVFLLAGMSNEPNDSVLIEELLRAVHAHVGHLEYGEIHRETVDAAVSPWLQQNESRLSEYWCARFRAGGGVGVAWKTEGIAHPVVPDALLDMPMRTLCMTLGSVVKHFGRHL